MKYYRKVASSTATRLDRCFASLETDPVGGANTRALRGVTGKYRYRVGHLRVVYEVDVSQRVVYVLAILPHGQAYKR